MSELNASFHHCCSPGTEWNWHSSEGELILRHEVHMFARYFSDISNKLFLFVNTLHTSHCWCTITAQEEFLEMINIRAAKSILSSQSHGSFSTCKHGFENYFAQPTTCVNQVFQACFKLKLSTVGNNVEDKLQCTYASTTIRNMQLTKAKEVLPCH